MQDQVLYLRGLLKSAHGVMNWKFDILIQHCLDIVSVSPQGLLDVTRAPERYVR
jgi:hypothetical protein